MKLIVGNALALQNCEAPGAAAPETKTQPADKGCAPKEDFAEKLKDCEKDSTAKVKPPDKEDDAKDSDNGMRDNPEDTVYGIVGILEGFEKPVYQTGNAADITAEGEQACAQIMPQQGQNENVLTLLSQNGDTETPGQIAGTLNTDEAGSGSAQTQEEILQIVGRHLDSLENTSKESGEAAPGGIIPEGQAADAKTGAQPQEAVTEAPEAAVSETVETKVTASRAEVYEVQTERSEKVQDTGIAGEEKRDTENIKGPETKAVPEHAAAADIKPAETGKASEQATAPEAAKPESARESILKIVDKVSTKASEGQYDFDVDLKPDFMGKVSIKLTMKDGDLKVLIRADDIAVKGMLQDQSASLQNMLKEKGIPVSNIDIAYDGSAAPDSEGQAQHGEGRNPGGNPFYEQAESAVFESAKEKYDFYLGNSNVEYLA